MNNKSMQEASELFFALLEQQVLPFTNDLVNNYNKNQEVRQGLKAMADAAGLMVMIGNQNIHLVASGVDSKFATSYTHMKSKYTGLKLKKYFYLANIIISIFLYLIDRDNNMRIQREEEGITYFKLESEVSKTLDHWYKQSKNNEEFSKKWQIDIEDIYPLWHNWPLKRGNDQEDISLLKKENKLGFIHEAIKPLKDQDLIIDHMVEYRIIPKEALYERIDLLYHRRDRFKEIKSLIEEGVNYGEN
jgi:hypothetical protein